MLYPQRGRPVNACFARLSVPGICRSRQGRALGREKPFGVAHDRLQPGIVQPGHALQALQLFLGIVQRPVRAEEQALLGKGGQQGAQFLRRHKGGDAGGVEPEIFAPPSAQDPEWPPACKGRKDFSPG